jgi:2-polyprenyl-6-methoxyphenol hydroxylase-like FAD-dependent oxidoreductase
VTTPTIPARAALGERAVVIGGGVAGLLAARALADHFRRVTLLERDAYPTGPESRKGVPQGQHVHGLLAQGLVVLDELFPGLAAEMTADGAVPIDWGRDLRWYYFGGYKPRATTGTEVLLFTRPFLERHLVRRLSGLGNVELVTRASVSQLLTGQDRRRITGVRLASAPPGDLPQDIEADLVVDASGRGSHSPKWLSDAGYTVPTTTQIGIDVRYTSRFYRRRSDDLPGAKVLYVVPMPPGERRGGAALPVDGDRWLVTLWGYFGDHPPTDDAGFVEFAKGLPASDIHDLVTRLEPISAPVAYGIPVSVRRHYDRMAELPERYLLVGDAVCAFNPVFAQGMTVAALEARFLDRSLRGLSSPAGLDGLGKRFLRGVSRMIELPWRMASHEDFRYPETRGRRTFGTGLANWYVARMQRASQQDLTVYRTFLQAMHMTRSPIVMFLPAILFRVLRPRRVMSAPEG